MLRESAKAQNQSVTIKAITDPAVDPELHLGRELRAFVDAIVLQDPHELPVAREDLRAAGGDGAVVRAAAVCASFESINRIVDSIGVPVNKKFYDIGDALGVSVPPHLT